MEYQGLLIGFSAFSMAMVCRFFIKKYGHILSGRMWPAILAIGIFAAISSFFINKLVISVAVAIFGCACLWTVCEKKVNKNNL